MKKSVYLLSGSGYLFLCILCSIVLIGAGGCKKDIDHDGYTAAEGDCRDDPKGDPLLCESLICGACSDESCRTCAQCIHPGAEEYPDWIDSNCNGFADEPPIGFEREGSSMQGFASAVDWYGDYVYVAAGSVLQVYDTGSGARPELTAEIEFRDWVRQMDVEGAMLFVAARGDGVIALDLSDPAHPQQAGHFRGTFTVDDSHTGVPALFHGIDALWDEQNQTFLVAVANANAVPANEGGIDAVVFTYDAAGKEFNLLEAFDSSVRSEKRMQVPTSVGLAESERSLYIGYGWPGLSLLPLFFDPYGELVYVPLDGAGAPLHKTGIGAVMDLTTRGNHAFAALTRACPNQECGILSRFTPGSKALTEAPVLQLPGGGPGGAVDVDGDVVSFSTISVGRYQDGNNLWAFTDLANLDAAPPSPPAIAGSAGTLDWVFQLACRDAGTESRIYVADEWGGLETWRIKNGDLTLDLGTDRVATGMFSLGMWNVGTKIYSIKEGAGLWVVDAEQLSHEQAAIEWINTEDPGCSDRCETYCPPPHNNEKCCCPPKTGSWPYPPAVFVSSGADSQGRVAVLAQNRNTAVPGDGYFMVFKEDSAAGRFQYQCLYSESWPGRAWSGNVIKAHDSFLFVTADVDTPAPPNELRLYQHLTDPAASDTVHLLGVIEMPSEPGLKDNLWSIVDIAVSGKYLFVAEAHQPLLAVPDRGRIYAFQWKRDDDGSGSEPATLLPAKYLGSFCVTEHNGFIPNRLLVDTARDRLIVGCTARYVPPVHQGAVLFYDSISACLENATSCFNSASPDSMETRRTDHSPDASRRALNTYPNINGIAVENDAMYIADFDNGLYKYALDSPGSPEIIGFYPAHRGSPREPLTPHMVMSPKDIIPLFHPISVGVIPSTGSLVVQEFMSGRITLLRDLQR